MSREIFYMKYLLMHSSHLSKTTFSKNPMAETSASYIYIYILQLQADAEANAS